MIYNSILRRWPKDLYDLYNNGENLFTTTIHVLVSAVQKLSRSIHIPDGTTLYRGLGGTMDLPDRFYNADVKGCKGFAEWGFMSTTSNRKVALQYSGVEEGKPKCLVLEIRVGAIDRGACLQKFSQYQGEEEYLYMPLSFLQQDRDMYTDVTAKGIVSIIPVRVIPNMKTQTVEEALDRKKSLHISAFAYHLDELEREITELMKSDKAKEALKVSRANGRARCDAEIDWDGVTTLAVVKNVMNKCRAVLSTHSKLDAADFTDDSIYRALTQEMVSTRTCAISTINCALEFWPDWRNLAGRYAADLDMLYFHRRYISFLKNQIHVTREPAPEEAAEVGRIVMESQPIFSPGIHNIARTPPGSVNSRGKDIALKICQVMGLVEKDVEAVNYRGESKLAVAVYDGVGLDGLGLLVDAGANPLGGISACCEEGNAEALALLVSSRADVTAVSPCTAAKFGHSECLRILINAKASVNGTRGNQITPLYEAAENGHVECVRTLLQLKANVHQQDPWGWSPLMTVTRRNNTEDRREKNKLIAQLLKDHGA
jgi:hypothetical protein